MLRTSHARSSLGFSALQVGSQAWAEPSCSNPGCQGIAAPAAGRMGLLADWWYQHQKNCTLMHTGKWNSKWWQTMGERKWGQSCSNYRHAQPQLQGLVGETKHETNEELGNSFSLKTDSMVLLCWSWNVIFYFLPCWQIWGKERALFTSSMYHAKENASPKECSCGKTEIELMNLPERGLSCYRATLQLQSFQELRGQASPTHQYTMYRLFQW